MVKVKQLLFIGILLGFMLACKTTYQPYSVKSHEIEGVKMYSALAGVSSKMDSIFIKRGIKTAIVVNGGSFEIKGKADFDHDKLAKYIMKLLPSRKSDALIVLDFEGKNMIDFKNGELAKRQKILAYYIDLYDFVKKMRPKTTIGFYAYPWRDYWNRNDGWRKENEELVPLLKHVDAIFPSIYDFYVDDKDVKRSSDQAYVEENIKEALRIAKLCGGKPVIPFIWHRYHDSNKKMAKQFIESDEFYYHVKKATETQYEGKGIEGIIWWSSERYFYNVSERGKINKRSKVDFEEYSNSTSLKYIDIIEQAIRDGAQKRN